MVLRVPERPKPPPLTLVGGIRLGLEVGRGGVEEEQIDLEVQQVGAGEEDRLLHPRLCVRFDQQVERAVGLVVVHPHKAGDRHVLGGPLGRRQLRAGRERAIRNEREQHPLDIGREPARAEQLAQRRWNP